MKIKYKITESSISTLEKFPYLKSVYRLPELGTYDERELTRLLENSHYSHIYRIIEQLDKYGEFCGEIFEKIISCNDTLNLSRFLAEFWLFIYLYDIHKSKVTPVHTDNQLKKPDIKLKLDKFEIRIEIYTPMDSYAFQTFTTLLFSKLKNLSSSKGFEVTINSKAEHFYYTHDFPDFRIVYSWLDDFENNFSTWLGNVKPGDSKEIVGPADSLTLHILFNKITDNPEIRFIIWGHATYSSDTKLYFEIDDPEKFAKTEWGVKIKDKLTKQQAGESKSEIIRILMINFSMADTTDILFFNDLRYYSRLEKNIKYLVADIKPYPPYDLVIPCELGPEKGFVKPVNISEFDDNLIADILKESGLDKTIKEIPMASKEETEQFWDAIINSTKNSAT